MSLERMVAERALGELARPRAHVKEQALDLAMAAWANQMLVCSWMWQAAGVSGSGEAPGRPRPGVAALQAARGFRAKGQEQAQLRHWHPFRLAVGQSLSSPRA